MVLEDLLFASLPIILTYLLFEKPLLNIGKIISKEMRN